MYFTKKQYKPPEKRQPIKFERDEQECILSINMSQICHEIYYVLYFYLLNLATLSQKRKNKKQLYLNVKWIMGFLSVFAGKESTCDTENTSLIPSGARSSGERMNYPHQYSWASLMAQMVNNLPALQEAWLWSWVLKMLDEGTAAPSSILSWRIPWTEEPGRLQPMGLQRVGHDWVSKHSTIEIMACAGTKSFSLFIEFRINVPLSSRFHVM